MQGRNAQRFAQVPGVAAFRLLQHTQDSRATEATLDEHTKHAQASQFGTSIKAILIVESRGTVSKYKGYIPMSKAMADIWRKEIQIMMSLLL